MQDYKFMLETEITGCRNRLKELEDALKFLNENPESVNILDFFRTSGLM